MNGNRGVIFDIMSDKGVDIRARRREAQRPVLSHVTYPCGDPDCVICFPGGCEESAEDEEYLRSEADRAQEEEWEAKAEEWYEAQRKGE